MSSLRPLSTIALPDVDGRIDHLALDLKRKRLYVAALENDTLEVVDLDKGVREKQIKELSEPQGVAYLADQDCVVVSNGGSGKLDVFDGASLERKHSIDVGADADNVRFDPTTHEVLVAVGNGAIVAVDAKTWTVSRKWELSAHPESFQLASDGARIFANVPGAKAVAVIDRKPDAKPSTWPLRDAGANYPMALVEPDRLLLVGCRQPARLLGLDATNGEQRFALELSGDCDDVFFDAATSRAFVACGAGFIDVLERGPSGTFARVEQIATASGARTCLLAPEQRRLYLAVPHRGDQRAEVRVFEIE